MKSGDAVGLISSWYGVSVAQLKAWNGLASNNIGVGQVLKVYVPAALESKYKVVNSLTYDEKQRMNGINPQTNTVKEEPLDLIGNITLLNRRYTLWNLSEIPCVTVDMLMKNNGITSASSLRIGQKLKIRKK